MSKVKDETGNTYHYLTVIERIESNSDGKARWKCRCKCGKEVNVVGVYLRNGDVKSCGCYQKERTHEASLKYKVGETVGNFTLLESI